VPGSEPDGSGGDFTRRNEKRRKRRTLQACARSFYSETTPNPASNIQGTPKPKVIGREKRGL